MSLDEGFIDFYDEFKEWTKKQILHRTYDICLENADKDKEIERLNNIINELEKSIIFKLAEFKRNKDYFIGEKDIEQLYEELKELKESGKQWLQKEEVQ